MAMKLDRASGALTLRLRELGGLIRVAGDLAVQESSEYVKSLHIERAQSLTKSLDSNDPRWVGQKDNISQSNYGDYFF